MTCMNKELASGIYNDGQQFKLSKEKYSLIPNSKLVGTSWRYTFGDIEKGTIYFKSVNEVLIDGKMRPYVCLGNTVSIKSGDNLEDENLVGTYNSESIELCRDGIAGKASDDNSICGTIRRIE